MPFPVGSQLTVFTLFPGAVTINCFACCHSFSFLHPISCQRPAPSLCVGASILLPAHNPVFGLANDHNLGAAVAGLAFRRVVARHGTVVRETLCLDP